jgi:acyl carrier protein
MSSDRKGKVMEIESSESIIRRFVAARLGTSEERLGFDDDLRALGLDSIIALQVVLDVEQHFAIEIEDHVVFAVETIREFAAAVDEIVSRQSGEMATP